MNNRILFVSSLEGWGGSEELWSRAAVNLIAEGFNVSASVVKEPQPHKRVLDLIRRGIDVRFCPKQYSRLERVWRRARSKPLFTLVGETERMIATRSPSLIVLSDGGPFLDPGLLEMCIEKCVPFVTIGHANWEGMWPGDEDAARYRATLGKALRCYFVSKANMQLAEKQLGVELPNAEVVWNPFNVNYNTAPIWPRFAGGDQLLLACVARLDPRAKGQDLLFEALAGPKWAARNWRLALYGEGPMRDGLERLAQRLGLPSEKVVFAGHREVEEIWRSNHVLVMPSRFEGLPLAMVEAMLCARPVVATNVAGHMEILQDEVTGFIADAPTSPSVALALERMWINRSRLEDMGKAGAKRIRSLVPADPAKVFAEKLKSLFLCPPYPRSGLV